MDRGACWTIVHGARNRCDWVYTHNSLVMHKRAAYLRIPYLKCYILIHGEGNGTPLQYSCLENPMDREAWKAAVHGVAEGQTRLSEFTFTFHFHALEKEMATHSSVLAWRIPGMGEPGGLLSLGLHRVGHDWSDLAVAVAKLSPFLKTKIVNFRNFSGSVPATNQSIKDQRDLIKTNPVLQLKKIFYSETWWHAGNLRALEAREFKGKEW